MFRQVFLIFLIFVVGALAIQAQDDDRQCRMDDHAFAYHLDKAAYFRGRTDFDDALWHYNCAVALEQTSIPALRGRAETLMMVEPDLAATGRELEAILRLDPDNLEVMVLRGDVYRLTDDNEAARIIYSEVINRDPDYAGAYIGRGHVSALELRVNEAVVDYEEAARLGYEPAYLPYIFIGDVYRAVGRPHNATTAYYQATTADPDHAESYLLLAEARIENGDLLAARNDYRRYANLVEDVPPNVQRQLVGLTLREVVLRFSPMIVFIGLSFVLIASYIWKKPENGEELVASSELREQAADTSIPARVTEESSSPFWWIAPLIGIGILGFLGRLFGDNDR